MTRINTIILLIILATSCLRPATRTEIVPVNLPAKPCEIPFPPKQPGLTATPYDCDGKGPGNRICIEEVDFMLIVVWMKKWIAWSEVVDKCESIKMTDDWKIKSPDIVETPVEESRI